MMIDQAVKRLSAGSLGTGKPSLRDMRTLARHSLTFHPNDNHNRTMRGAIRFAHGKIISTRKKSVNFHRGWSIFTEYGSGSALKEKALRVEKCMQT